MSHQDNLVLALGGDGSIQKVRIQGPEGFSEEVASGLRPDR